MGFAIVILLGSGLLMLPCSVKEGVDLRYIDALYTSTSAVCVTGLIAVDVGDTFTPLGQTILALLIQVGGLGVTSVGAGIIVAMGRRVNLKGRTLIREALNVDSGKGLIVFIKSIFWTTLFFELTGAALSFLVFVQDYPPLRALGISLFHSVAAFNNSGFDILGNFQSLTNYRRRCAAQSGHLRPHLLRRHRLPGHPGTVGQEVPLAQAVHARPGGPVLQLCAHRHRHGAAQTHREHHLAGRFVPERLRPYRRLLPPIPWVSSPPPACWCMIDPHVHRRLPGLHRRRRQDQHGVCAVPGHQVGGHQQVGEGLPLFHPPGGFPQGGSHHAAGHVPGAHRHLPDGYLGAGRLPHRRPVRGQSVPSAPSASPPASPRGCPTPANCCPSSSCMWAVWAP